MLYTKGEAPTLGRVKDHCNRFKSYDDVLVYAAEDVAGDVIMENADDVVDEARSVDHASSRQRRAPANSMASNRAVYGKSETVSMSARGGKSIPDSYGSSLSEPSTSGIGDAALGGVDGSQGPNAIVNVELSEHQLFLLSPTSLTFALKTKQWCKSDCLLTESGKDPGLANFTSGHSSR